MSVFLYAEINLVCILALGIMAGRILRTPRPDPGVGGSLSAWPAAPSPSL